MAENDTPETTDIVEKTTASVLITGGNTPTGRAVTRLLHIAGHQVAAMTTTHEGSEQVRADGGLPIFADPTRAGEIKGMMDLREVDVVVHAAPLLANETPFVAADYSGDDLLAQTTALIEAAVAAEVKYIVHLSYAALYGNTGDHAVTEDAAVSANESGLLKAAIDAENAVRESGIPHCILRAGYVYSADTAALHQVFEAILGGRAVHTGSGDNKAAWVHASDLANAIAAAVDQRPENAVFNVVDEEPASPGAFASYLSEAQGVSSSNALAGLFKMFNRQKPHDALDFSTLVSNGAIKEALGWAPRFKSFKDGIDDLLLSWRSIMPGG